MEAHGGRIWAESDGPGLGARFTFTIPVAGDAAAGVPRLSDRRERAERERTRILAVDDDPQALRHVRDALARAGYEPIVTGDPQEALSQVEANDPHLVLLDLMLPGTDGIELMGNILDMADVPVIFLSAYGQEETIARAFEKRADDYVVKPFSPTELVARIKAALRKREAPEWAEPSEPYVLGELAIDYAERRVTLAGRPVQLTAIEYGLLFELSANAGRVMTYDRLLRRVWGLRGSGACGAPGPAGLRGLRGSGACGAPGPAGLRGLRGSGACGAPGPAGLRGLRGSGACGAPGPAGLRGLRGSGACGAPGPAGLRGLRGSGACGAPGLRACGACGAAGLRGLRGCGAPGPAGLRGLRGSGASRRVRTAAKQLRRKLGDDANNPTYILNEPRVGYRMPKGEMQEREET